ncbi:MAG: hypothetical protein AB8G96_02260 [Phycisphaerales bacterium]
MKRLARFLREWNDVRTDVGPRRRSRRSRWPLATAALIAGGNLLLAGGCAAFGIVGAMGQSFETQKLIEVAPLYRGLEGQTVAVVVNVGLDISWNSPQLGANVATVVSQKILENVNGVSVLDPRGIQAWQYRTPQWDAMAYGEIAEALNADRIVYVDVYEYRLNPPGNRFLWDGAVGATVGIIEADGFDNDSFIDTFEVNVRFPDIEGITREDVAESAIAQGLTSKFITRVAWLFYKHEEPKYPDLYKPELDQ